MRDQRGDPLIVGIGGVDGDEARHTVDVAADASRRLTSKSVVIILNACVHDQSSADTEIIASIATLDAPFWRNPLSPTITPP